jgi:hypothetical protein
VFTAPLRSNRRPTVERVCCGNVFIETLPSNEYTHHNILHFVASPGVRQGKSREDEHYTYSVRCCTLICEAVDSYCEAVTLL